MTSLTGHSLPEASDVVSILMIVSVGFENRAWK